jgi:hypothetical protein
MLIDPQPVESTAGLRPKRLALGISTQVAANHFHLALTTISRPNAASVPTTNSPDNTGRGWTGPSKTPIYTNRSIQTVGSPHRWLGEAEGLKVRLAGTRTKPAEMDQITERLNTTQLGMPTFPKPPAAPTSPRPWTNKTSWSSAPTPPPPWCPSSPRCWRACVPRAEIYTQVEALVEDHPLHPVLMSIPTVGIRTEARILTEVVGKEFG